MFQSVKRMLSNLNIVKYVYFKLLVYVHVNKKIIISVNMRIVFVVCVLAVVLAMTAGVPSPKHYLRLMRRPTQQPVVTPVAPGEWARREFDLLESQRLPERGDVEGFFVRLSDVVRTYVERRYQIAAPDQTTQEFLSQAAHHPDLAGEHERTLGAFLRSADMVKFAAARPASDTCAHALTAMRGFVERTAPPPSEVEP